MRPGRYSLNRLDAYTYVLVPWIEGDRLRMAIKRCSDKSARFAVETLWTAKPVVLKVRRVQA